MPRWLLAATSSLLIWCGARAETFQTKRFETFIQVSPDHSVRFIEEIRVTFTKPTKGIVRTISSSPPLNSGSKQPVQFELISVGMELPHSRPKVVSCIPKTVGDSWVLEIGDPNSIVQGTVRYRIEYIARGLLILDPNAKFFILHWGVPGSHWNSKTDVAQVRVSFPKVDGRSPQLRLDDHSAALHNLPSRLQTQRFELALSADQKASEFAVAKIVSLLSMAPGQSLRLAVSMPMEAFGESVPATMAVQAQQLPAQAPQIRIPDSPIGWFAPLLVIPFLYQFTAPRSLRPRRRVLPQNQAPEGISAPLAGWLLELPWDVNCAVATLLELEQHGFLRLVRDDGGARVFCTSERDRPTEGLQGYFMGALCPETGAILPDVVRKVVRGAAFDAPIVFRNEAEKLGLIRPMNALGGCAIATGFFVGLLTISVISLFFSFVPTLITFAVSTVIGIALIARMTPFTTAGIGVAEKLRGLRAFLVASQTEKNHLSNWDQDARLAPYAVAFGLWPDTVSGRELDFNDPNNGPRSGSVNAHQKIELLQSWIQSSAGSKH